MKNFSKFSVATIITILVVTFVSTCWIFIPAFFHDPSKSYLWNQAVFYSFWAASVTGIIVVVLGIPVYVVLDRKGKASRANLALVGFVIPVIILSIFLINSLLTSSDGGGSYSAGQNYHGTYREMVVDNKRTIWGWIGTIEEFITFGIYGLLGATVFGEVVRRLKTI